jgi:hypothetical protein
MAYTIKELTTVANVTKLSELPDGLSNATNILESVIGAKEDIDSIQCLYSDEVKQEALLELKVQRPTDAPLQYTPKEGWIYIWLSKKEDQENISSVVFFEGDSFQFIDAYQLYSGAAVVSSPTFWQGSVVFFSSEESNILPSGFLDLATSQTNLATLKSKLPAKDIYLALGLNLIHQWQLDEALSTFNLGPFANLISNTALTLLANEQEAGMFFTLLLEDIQTPLDDYLKNFLSLEAVSFSVFHSFATESFPTSFARLAAEAKFLDKSCIVEAGIPLQGTNGILSLDIYPQETLALTGDGSAANGLSFLLDKLGIADVTIPDIFPSLGLEMTYLKVALGSSGIDSIQTQVQLSSDNENGYEVVPNLFSLYQIGVQVNWSKGAGVSFQVSGGMNAFSYDFFLSYAYPSHIIQGKLAPGVDTSKSIKELVKSTGAPEVVGSAIAAVATAFEISIYADVEGKGTNWKKASCSILS